MAKRKAFKSHKRQRIYNKTQGRCGYCGVNLAPDNFQVDHIHPLARGGTNLDINLVASCETCNKSKGKMTVSEFKEYILNQVDKIRASNGKFRLMEHFGMIWVRKESLVFYFESPYVKK